MEQEKETVEPQDEIKEEESTEEVIEEPEEVEEPEEDLEDEPEEDDENSNQLQEVEEELKRKDAEIAKLNRLLNKKDKKKAPKKSEGQKAKADDHLTKEEAILYARGLSEAEVEKVMSIAKIEGESPLVAAESDYFKIWKDKEDQKKEAQETQLGTSRGAIKKKPKKDFNSEGLSDDEHKALWRQKMGR